MIRLAIFRGRFMKLRKVPIADNRRCCQSASRVGRGEHPVRLIDCFVDSLDLASLGFEGIQPSAKGRVVTRSNADVAEGDLYMGRA
jgi:hypothetical protein